MTKIEIEAALLRAEAKIVRMKQRLKRTRDKVLTPDEREATWTGVQELRSLCTAYRERLLEMGGRR